MSQSDQKSASPVRRKRATAGPTTRKKRKSEPCECQEKSLIDKAQEMITGKKDGKLLGNVEDDFLVQNKLKERGTSFKNILTRAKGPKFQASEEAGIAGKILPSVYSAKGKDKPGFLRGALGGALGIGGSLLGGLAGGIGGIFSGAMEKGEGKGGWSGAWSGMLRGAQKGGGKGRDIGRMAGNGIIDVAQGATGAALGAAGGILGGAGGLIADIGEAGYNRYKGNKSTFGNRTKQLAFAGWNTGKNTGDAIFEGIDELPGLGVDITRGAAGFGVGALGGLGGLLADVGEAGYNAYKGKDQTFGKRTKQLAGGGFDLGANSELSKLAIKGVASTAAGLAGNAIVPGLGLGATSLASGAMAGYFGEDRTAQDISAISALAGAGTSLGIGQGTAQLGMQNMLAARFAIDKGATAMGGTAVSIGSGVGMSEIEKRARL